MKTTYKLEIITNDFKIEYQHHHDEQVAMWMLKQCKKDKDYGKILNVRLFKIETIETY